MPSRVVWRIAAPMIGLGLVLLGLGIDAAWNVHSQQQTSSELIEREVRGMVVIEELHMAIREIRYQINMFLRTRDRAHLDELGRLNETSAGLIKNAKQLARSGREQEKIEQVEQGFQHFLERYHAVTSELPAPSATAGSSVRLTLTDEVVDKLSYLADDFLTNEILQPLKESIATNQEVVDRTTQASQKTAQHLKIGFLLLGICGGAAGLLLGLAIARAIGKSIVRLDVTVRGVQGKLSGITGPVSFSHTSDLNGVETGLKSVESHIADVVERLQQRELEVLRSEQLARVGQIAAGLAHELRNPLMPMKMLVQAAIAKGEDGGLKGRSLQVLNDEISRLEEAIQEFLDFARPPVPNTSTVPIEPLLKQTLDLVRPRAQMQSVELRLKVPPDPVMADVDGDQIRQLVLNLVLNALDAQPDGGSVTVELLPCTNVSRVILPQEDRGEAVGAGITEHDALRMLTGPAQKSSRPAVNWFGIRVTDAGPGIPPAMLEEIFEPFVTNKETGTGLGLSNCRRIATAHHGTLEVRNRLQGGAEFELLLPCQAHPRAA